MGTVYKARHARLKRIVALKVLPEDRIRDERAVARFEREMEAVGKLEHPNIVKDVPASRSQMADTDAYLSSAFHGTKGSALPSNGNRPAVLIFP